jgi:hypothetical protein
LRERLARKRGCRQQSKALRHFPQA